MPGISVLLTFIMLASFALFLSCLAQEAYGVSLALGTNAREQTNKQQHQKTHWRQHPEWHEDWHNPEANLISPLSHGCDPQCANHTHCCHGQCMPVCHAANQTLLISGETESLQSLPSTTTDPRLAARSEGALEAAFQPSPSTATEPMLNQKAVAEKHPSPPHGGVVPSLYHGEETGGKWAECWCEGNSIATHYGLRAIGSGRGKYSGPNPYADWKPAAFCDCWRDNYEITNYDKEQEEVPPGRENVEAGYVYSDWHEDWCRYDDTTDEWDWWWRTCYCATESIAHVDRYVDAHRSWGQAPYPDDWFPAADCWCDMAPVEVDEPCAP